MAIVSLVTALLVAPLGVVFGHISLSQIKKSGEEGRGLAVAGLVVGYVLTALTIVVVAIAVWFTSVMVNWSNQFTDERNRTGFPRNGPSGTANPLPDRNLPSFTPPATLGSNCQYPKTTEPASKPATPPRTGRVPTTPPIVGATMETDLGPIGLQLDNAKAPCTVNNFASLSQQGFFDATTCHRLTTSESLGVLQCGDPTGSGTGGPGYQFPNEYPTNQYRLADPALKEPVLYPRGTLAMANAGPGTNGSQFFLVYADSQLPPSYTVFGSIDTTGLGLLDKVAAAGVKGGGDDGPPNLAVTIDQVRLD
ncbi:peptidylprolyl isomerase [Mycolicibacterium arenosum]|uniref:Peptidylprolyl isomerase n=1 Tax=Mycolicibacterium arenosum TaxID=2952157 RepID=A0ABT1M1Y1_9MYCO|nr:peptidylprolyl isomerase [Mycolicibacterium sp. CAU 1645]MCP9272885.1 peptidylprolyl isomerase [Mycolicibacterium sp. CAU 1645]